MKTLIVVVFFICVGGWSFLFCAETDEDVERKQRRKRRKEHRRRRENASCCPSGAFSCCRAIDFILGVCVGIALCFVFPPLGGIVLVGVCCNGLSGGERCGGDRGPYKH